MSIRETVAGALRQDKLLTSDRGWAANLAIFRVIFLGLVALPWALRCLHWTLDILPGLPRESWVTISFYQLLPLDILSNAWLDRALALADVILIALGLVGLRTRVSIGLATILSFYLFGLMENQGKIDHFHHVVWFMAMLAAGPSGLLLSVDALRQAIKRADSGRIEQPVAPIDALLTLRYIWILMGLIYLGPGIAKFYCSLTEGWAGTTNLQNLFLRKWVELSWYDPSFTPPIRVDRLPRWIIDGLGWAAIVFEAGFLFAVAFRCLRPILALVGTMFHVFNGIFLGIWFTTLIPTYACLIDWSAFGRRHRPLIVVYDGGCRLCRRTIAVLKSIDLFDVLDPVAGLSDDPRRPQFTEITDEMLVRDLYVIRGTEAAGGYDAYAQIARRVILLWPIALIMRLPPVATAGRRIYRRVADSRHCVLKLPDPPPKVNRVRRSTFVHTIGMALVAGQFVISSALLLYPFRQSHRLTSVRLLAPAIQLVDEIGQHRLSWPFDLYPTFAGLTDGKIEVFEARWILADGGEQQVTPTAYWRAFGNSGLTWVITSHLPYDPDAEHRRNLSLDLVRVLWRAERPDVRKSVLGARIYRVRYQLQPAQDSMAKLLDEVHVFTFPMEQLANRGGSTHD
jgi:predicted DCC family thiol-disulfide oxidoreductase YuxK